MSACARVLQFSTWFIQWMESTTRFLAFKRAIRNDRRALFLLPNRKFWILTSRLSFACLSSCSRRTTYEIFVEKNSAGNNAILVKPLTSLSKRSFCQDWQWGTGLKTVFASVCGNLQHIWHNKRFLKFFCFLTRALWGKMPPKLVIPIFEWRPCLTKTSHVVWSLKTFNKR
jgi:hypothetical protein